MASLPADGPPGAGARRLGPFVLEEELGRGAHGTVFRARGPDGAPVALKVLTRPGGSPRFEREVRALLRLRHAHLVRSIASGAGPPPWVAMELVEGESLEAALRRGPLAPARAARLVGEVALALDHAHAQGLVHRDVKPANLLLRAGDGSAVLTDFGLALDLEDVQRLTRTGALVGTPSAMAPEQLQGDPRAVGPPADVWGLGVTLYRCLTGEEPFPAGDMIELARAVESGRIRPPRELVPSIPPALEAACLDCLQRDPARRPSAAELARRLLGTAAGAGRGARPGTALAAALVLLLLLLAGGAALLSVPRSPQVAPPAAPVALRRLELQPGFADGVDTYVSDVGLYGDDNFGADYVLLVGERNLRRQAGDFRAYLRFDLSALPAGVEVRAARLELYWIGLGFLDDAPRGPLRLRLFRVAAPWEEGSSAQDDWLDGIAWTPRDRPELAPPEPLRDGPGADGALAELALESPPPPRWIDLDATAAVRAWAADPGSNHGLLLAHADEGPPWERGVAHFAASDHQDPALRPRLVVEWVGDPPRSEPSAAGAPARDAVRSDLERLEATRTDPFADLRAANDACRAAPELALPYLVRAGIYLDCGQSSLAWRDVERASRRTVEPRDEPLLVRVTVSASEALSAQREDEASLWGPAIRETLELLERRGIGRDDPGLRRLRERVGR